MNVEGISLAGKVRIDGCELAVQTVVKVGRGVVVVVYLAREAAGVIPRLPGDDLANHRCRAGAVLRHQPGGPGESVQAVIGVQHLVRLGVNGDGAVVAGVVAGAVEIADVVGGAGKAI